MAIKIHWGANGAYKTSGAIQDDAVPALLAGRVIVTNIRGFTLERVYSVFPNLPETAQIINLELDSLEDLEKMRTWFMWVPLGAFVIFDEAQLVFPKSWREKDLEKFDYPGGMEAAKEANRPFNWLDAWTRHRHFGFDVVLTTPNISYIRDDIRSTCETAYRHANLAVIGIKGRYKEAQHDAQLNRPPADGTIIRYKKIKPETFKLYGSTATGSVRDTFAGQSLFKSPKVLGFVALLAYLLYSVATSASNSVLFGGSLVKPAAAVKDSSSFDVEAIPVLDPTVGGVSNPRLSDVPIGSPHSLVHPFSGHDIKIVARLVGPDRQSLYAFQLENSSGDFFIQNSKQLLEAGYTMTQPSDCYVVLLYGNAKIPVSCKGRSFSQPQPAVNVSSVSAVPAPSEAEGTRFTVIPHERNGFFFW